MVKWLLSGFFLLTTVCLATGGGLRENEMIIGGGSSEADGLWVSGPSFYLRRGAPGQVMGMVQFPGKNRQYAYVLVIKGDEQRKTLAHYDGINGVAGPTAKSWGFLEIAPQKVVFEYQAAIDPKGKQEPHANLRINGKVINLDQGRVVLVDLAAKKETWKQIRSNLPKSPAWPKETRDIESQAREMLDHLKRESNEVRQFLK